MCSIRPNVVWALDFQFDQTSEGRMLKFLNVVDEFIAQAVADWCRFRGTGTVVIDPGSPWQNAWIESCNGRMRDEFLNGPSSTASSRLRSSPRPDGATTTTPDPLGPRLAHPGQVRRALGPPTAATARMRSEDLPLGVGEVGAVAAARRRQSTLLAETWDGEVPQLTAFSVALWAVVPGPVLGSAFALVETALG
jgi:putative transposase